MPATLYIDADACPVKDEAVRVAERHGLAVHFVSNKWMRLPHGPLIERVVVSDSPDAADDWIAERAGKGDIVVTADIPLAARCLKTGARVVGPTGKLFTEAGIGMALAMRDLSRHLRETGESKGYNATFTRQDRSRFLQALEEAVQAIRARQVGELPAKRSGLTFILPAIRARVAHMNEHLRPDRLPNTTQAAEGLPRRRWTVAEIEAMVAQGIILEDERFELVGGEVVPMSPKGIRHEVVKAALQQHWFPLIVGSPINLITETTLYVGVDEFREPDFLFWPRSIAIKEVTAASALLIVEVADSSLRYDLKTKAPVYAKLGLPEYWVVDAMSLVTYIHRNPKPDGYPAPRKLAPNKLLEPLLAPQLAVRLTELGLTPAA